MKKEEITLIFANLLGEEMQQLLTWLDNPWPHRIQELKLTVNKQQSDSILLFSFSSFFHVWKILSPL